MAGESQPDRRAFGRFAEAKWLAGACGGLTVHDLTFIPHKFCFRTLLNLAAKTAIFIPKSARIFLYSFECLHRNCCCYSIEGK